MSTQFVQITTTLWALLFNCMESSVVQDPLIWVRKRFFGCRVAKISVTSKLYVISISQDMVDDEIDDINYDICCCFSNINAQTWLFYFRWRQRKVCTIKCSETSGNLKEACTQCVTCRLRSPKTAAAPLVEMRRHLSAPLRVGRELPRLIFKALTLKRSLTLTFSMSTEVLC